MTSVYTTLAGGPQERWPAGSSWLVCEPVGTNLMAYGVKFSRDAWAKNQRTQAHVRTAYDVVFSPLDHNSCYERGLGVSDHRCDGFIYTSDGRVSVFVELKDRESPNKNLDEIAQACIVQNEYGKIDVKVLPKSGFAPESICKELAGELEARLKGFEINCTAVRSDIDFVRSTRGKMIMLVQNIKG